MLKQRVITALVLLAILLPALFWNTPQPFLAVAVVLVAAGGWEWGRLNGLGQGASVAVGLLTLALCAALWALGWTQSPELVLVVHEQRIEALVLVISAPARVLLRGLLQMVVDRLRRRMVGRDPPLSTNE